MYIKTKITNVSNLAEILLYKFLYQHVKIYGPIVLKFQQNRNYKRSTLKMKVKDIHDLSEARWPYIEYKKEVTKSRHFEAIAKVYNFDVDLENEGEDIEDFAKVRLSNASCRLANVCKRYASIMISCYGATTKTVTFQKFDLELKVKDIDDFYQDQRTNVHSNTHQK